MALGAVNLKLMLDDKEFKSSMNKAVGQVKNSVNLMKNILIGAQLGRYLFAGAGQQAQEELKQVQTALSAIAEGLDKTMILGLQDIIESLDFLGVGADQAADSLYKFILTGKAMGLQSLGIYLDKDTASMLSAMDAAERYQWAIENIPEHLQNITDNLSDTTKAYYEFQKRADDVKKALGTSFMSVLVGLIDGFGGLQSALTTAIVAFTAYKTAMILGNVGIGISKTIAMGGVFVAPVALAMGVGALAAIGVLIGGASMAIGALNSVSSNSSAGTTGGNEPLKGERTIVVVKDKYGETQKSISQSSSSRSSSVQTNYGGSS